MRGGDERERNRGETEEEKAGSGGGAEVADPPFVAAHRGTHLVRFSFSLSIWIGRSMIVCVDVL